MYFNFQSSICPPIRLQLGRNISILVVISILLKIFTELFLGLELSKTFAPFGGFFCVCSSLFQTQENVGVVFLSFKCEETHLW